MSGREREPLAFRVKPLPAECFESWLQRLAERHETTRKALFRHLGIELALADYDLASSACLEPERRTAMVGRLAWATTVPEKAIVRTFVGCGRADLLPRALRSIGCAQCWLEWLVSGAPWRIERGWILRVATRCEHHELLLTDLRGIKGLGRSAAAQRLLEETVDRTRAQMAQFTFVKTRLAWNLVISRAHIRGNPSSFWAFSARYCRALVGNRFHFAPARHLLLAALHSQDTSQAERIERIFRFEAQPVRHASVRRPVGLTPKLSDLAATIASIGRRQLGHQRLMLRATCRQMEQAWRNYPSVHSAHMLRIQRAALASEVRSRYAAEIAGTVTTPLTCLRGFQDALFYLKQCGMADDAVPTAPSHRDPWEDCLDDVRVLQRRLAHRFACPQLCYVLGFTGYSNGGGQADRASSLSMSAMALSNSARLSAENAGESGRERLTGAGLPPGEAARITT